MVHEFLVASLLQRLVTLLVRRQGLFVPAVPASAGVRMLDALGVLYEPLAAVVRESLPDVTPHCGLAHFDPAGIELRVWSRINGFTEPTHDGASDDGALGFVLFLHREPRRFEGGSLHLHAPAGESVIEPSQNSAVFFRSSVAVRVGAVRSVSTALIDSRLTVEGWIRAPRPPR